MSAECNHQRKKFYKNFGPKKVLFTENKKKCTNSNIELQNINITSVNTEHRTLTWKKEWIDILIEPLLSSLACWYVWMKREKEEENNVHTCSYIKKINIYLWINLVLNVSDIGVKTGFESWFLIEYISMLQTERAHMKANLTKERHKFKIIWIYVN